MTSQTKKFIELSDLIALRLECKNQKCKATVMISSFQELRKDALGSCPMCKEPWAVINGGSCELAISQFMDAFRALDNMIGSQGHFPAGFSLTLEIRDEAKSSASQLSALEH